MSRIPGAVIVCATLVALAFLAAYVVLTLNGFDAAGLTSTAVTLLGVLGLGAHVEHRTRQQNAVIGKIDKQTNGVLDGKIKAGAAEAARQVLSEMGYTTGPGGH